MASTYVGGAPVQVKPTSTKTVFPALLGSNAAPSTVSEVWCVARAGLNNNGPLRVCLVDEVGRQVTDWLEFFSTSPAKSRFTGVKLATDAFPQLLQVRAENRSTASHSVAEVYGVLFKYATAPTPTITETPATAQYGTLPVEPQDAQAKVYTVGVVGNARKGKTTWIVRFADEEVRDNRVSVTFSTLNVRLDIVELQAVDAQTHRLDAAVVFSDNVTYGQQHVKALREMFGADFPYVMVHPFADTYNDEELEQLERAVDEHWDLGVVGPGYIISTELDDYEDVVEPINALLKHWGYDKDGVL